MEKKSCGPHVQLAANDAARVSRCPCGAVHLTLLRSGVTVRLNDESLRGTTRALMSALDRLEESEGVPIN